MSDQSRELSDAEVSEQRPSRRWRVSGPVEGLVAPVEEIVDEGASLEAPTRAWWVSLPADLDPALLNVGAGAAAILDMGYAPPGVSWVVVNAPGLGAVASMDAGALQMLHAWLLDHHPLRRIEGADALQAALDASIGEIRDDLPGLLAGLQCLEGRGHLQAARARLIRLLDRVREEPLPPQEPLRGKAMLWEALLFLRLGHLQPARDAAERAVAQADRHGWDALKPVGLWLLGVVASLDGSTTARAVLERALQLFQDQGGRGGALYTQLSLFLLLQHTADFSAAQARLDAARVLADELGDLRGQNEVLFYQSGLWLRAGERGAALEGYSQVEAMSRRCGDERRLAHTLLALARLQLNQSGTSSLLNESLERFSQIADPTGQGSVLYTLGLSALRAGRLDEANIHLLQSESLLRHALPQRADASLLSRCQVLFALGRTDEAVEILEPLRRELQTRSRSLLGYAEALSLIVVEPRSTEWGLCFERACSLLDEVRRSDPEVAMTFVAAGEAAEAAGEMARAARAFARALQIWLQLDVEGAVAEQRARLRALGLLATPIPLGVFELLEPLGRGGMAQVWSGRHRASGHPVAVKILSDAQTPEARAEFENEVFAIARLAHPHIVPVLDYGALDDATEVMSCGALQTGSPYLVMALAEGGSLRSHCGQLPWPSCRKILLDLLDALAHAHARGVVHRDLKPSNVLIQHKASAGPLTIRLADFGLAHLLDRDHDSVHIAGTPHYMAPEQFSEHWAEIGPWTDLYAMGCLAVALLQGHPLHAGLSLKKIQEARSADPLPQIRPRIPVPEGLDLWIRCLLRRDPLKRFACAADATQALLRLDDAPLLRPLDPAPVAPVSAADTLSLTFPMLPILEVPAVGSDEEAPAAPRDAPPVPLDWRPGYAPSRAWLQGAGLGLLGLRAGTLGSSLAGREEEQDRIWGALHQVAASRRPQALLLRGPTGFGKSSLLRWLGERAEELGVARALYLTCRESEPEIAPFHRMVREWLRGRGLEVQATRRRLIRTLEVMGEPDTSLADGIFTLLGDEQRELNAEECKDLMTRWIARLTDERPAVLLMDDVLWSELGSDWARQLLASREVGPLLIVMSMRDDMLAERQPYFDELDAMGGRFETIEIGAIHNIDALIREMIDLEEGLGQEVVAKSGGNPLFVVELLCQWSQHGVLVFDEGRFRLAADREVTLPDGMHALWSDRIHRLTAALDVRAQRALERAAALGVEVSRAEWELACAPDWRSLLPRLEQRLFASGLALPGQSGWVFSQPLLRDSLLRTAAEWGRLSEHHVACGQAIRELDASAHARLGRHLYQGGDPAASLEPLLRGAEAAVRRAEFDEAESLIALREQALAQHGVAASDVRWGRGQSLLARLRHDRGALAEAESLAEALTSAAEKWGWEELVPEAMLIAGLAARAQGRCEIAESRLTGSLERFEALQHVRGQGEALFGLGLVHISGGRMRAAFERFALSLQMLQQAPEPRSVAPVLHGLAAATQGLDQPEQAERWFDRALGAADAEGNLDLKGQIFNGLGDLARSQGQLELAEARYRAARDLMDRLGSGSRIYPRLNLGLLYLALEQPDLAVRAMEDAMPIAIAQGRRGLLCAVFGIWMVADPSRWSELGARFEALQVETGFVAPDLRWCFELAAERAAAAGDAARAEDARRLAALQQISPH